MLEASVNRWTEYVSCIVYMLWKEIISRLGSFTTKEVKPIVCFCLSWKTRRSTWFRRTIVDNASNSSSYLSPQHSSKRDRRIMTFPPVCSKPAFLRSVSHLNVILRSSFDCIGSYIGQHDWNLWEQKWVNYPWSVPSGECFNRYPYSSSFNRLINLKEMVHDMLKGFSFVLQGCEAFSWNWECVIWGVVVKKLEVRQQQGDSRRDLHLVTGTSIK